VLIIQSVNVNYSECRNIFQSFQQSPSLKGLSHIVHLIPNLFILEKDAREVTMTTTKYSFIRGTCFILVMLVIIHHHLWKVKHSFECCSCSIPVADNNANEIILLLSFSNLGSLFGRRSLS